MLSGGIVDVLDVEAITRDGQFLFIVCVFFVCLFVCLFFLSFFLSFQSSAVIHSLQMHSLPMLYAGGLVWGLSNGWAFTPPVAALLNWFPERKVAWRDLLVRGSWLVGARGMTGCWFLS